MGLPPWDPHNSTIECECANPRGWVYLNLDQSQNPHTAITNNLMDIGGLPIEGSGETQCLRVSY